MKGVLILAIILVVSLIVLFIVAAHSHSSECSDSSKSSHSDSSDSSHSSGSSDMLRSSNSGSGRFHDRASRMWQLGKQTDDRPDAYATTS